VEPELKGQSIRLHAAEAWGRLDVFVSQQTVSITRSRAQRLIQNGLVAVNDLPCKSRQPVHAGDSVTIHIPDDTIPLRPEALPLKVLYEDSEVIVIDKPPGIVVHPAPGHEEHTLVNALLARYPGLDSGDVMRPGIVHRLDKDTSGVMIVARNADVREWLISQFKCGAVRKVYLALVAGRLTSDGTIDGPIGRHPVHRKKMAIVPFGKPARTDYSVVEQFDEFTLIEARPLTGRTHQIRVHFASIGHPVAGDLTYAQRSSWRHLGPVLQRHFLHASSLRLKLQYWTDEREFSSPLPDDLKDVLSLARRLSQY